MALLFVAAIIGCLSIWTEEKGDNEAENLLSYPVDADGWDEETQKDFINYIENEFKEDTSKLKMNLRRKHPHCKSFTFHNVTHLKCNKGSGAIPFKGSSGVAGTSTAYNHRKLQNLFKAKSCPPIYACKSPTNANKCCSFQIIYGRHYCDYRNCYRFF